MPQKSIEERLDRIEKQVAALMSAIQKNRPQNWIDAVTGSAENDSDFAEILRLGKEIRDAEDMDEE